MNVDLYLFGDFGSGYTQYIDDNTRIKFKSFIEKAKANSQLIIHRDETLMYYTYIRRLHGESSNLRYIGISYVLSGHSIRDIEGLFSLFEGAITTIASRGIVLKYTPDGHIVTNVEKIYQVKSEFAHISAYLKSELDAFMLDRKFELPTLDYSINTSEVRTFKFSDSHEEIIKSLATIPTVYVFKDKNYENEESKSFSNILSSLNKEKQKALQVVEKQKSEITSLKRAQKNYKLVIWLIVVIFVGLLCVMSYVSNTNVRIQGLESDKIELNAIIEEKVKELDKARLDINNLLSTKNRLNTRILNLRKDSSSFVSKIANLESKLQDKELDIDMKFIEIVSLNEKIKEKDNEISRLKKQIPSKSSYNTSASSYGVTKTVGATISKMGPSYDNTYALWLSAQKKLRINSFYIKANKSGYITLGLYNSYGSLLTSKRVKVTKGETTKVSFSDFTISKGKYYLAIEKSNDISLCYHKVSGGEYDFNQFDVLQILGYSAKGERTPNNNKSYYQYFYDINYTVLE